MDVCSRMREEDSTDYDKVKEALLNQCDCTEDRYRTRFREARPELDESPDQFMVRLHNYLDRWVQLAKVVKSLFVQGRKILRYI